MGGSGNDTMVFLQDAAVNMPSVVKLDAGNDSLVFNSNTVSGQFGAGAGDDYIGGASSLLVPVASASGVEPVMTPSTSAPFPTAGRNGLLLE